MHLLFLCTGNICRSPMAEVMARDALERAGLGDAVEVSSRGTHGFHEGDGMDDRAAAELRAHGLPDAHVAHRLRESDLDADLLVALARGHREHLLDAGADPDRVVLLRSFDPEADDPDVADPYYGDTAGFTRTYDDIAAALPGLVEEIRARVG